MKSSAVRLSELRIQNFKNVKNGVLNFNNRRKNYRAGILGLYGQNGSGKTALIDALQLLKYALCGKTVPAEMAEFIHVDAEYAALSYTFHITMPSGRYEAFYEFCIRKEEDAGEQNFDADIVRGDLRRSPQLFLRGSRRSERNRRNDQKRAVDRYTHRKGFRTGFKV